MYLDDPNRTANAEGSIRCLIADDHVLVRQGIRRLLQDESDIEIVGEAGDAAEALKGVMEFHPDIVLMDIGMPGYSSFEAARVIQSDFPGTRVVFLTMHEDHDYVMQGLQAGAAGYLLKDTPSSKLASVLREVHQGGKFVSPEVLGGLLESGKFGPPDRPRPDRIPSAGVPDGAPRPGVLARAIARRRLGQRYLYRRAHRGRACRALAQGDQPWPHGRPDPHRARRRLCARRPLRARELTGDSL